jgi:hypothetical protein
MAGDGVPALPSELHNLLSLVLGGVLVVWVLAVLWDLRRWASVPLYLKVCVFGVDALCFWPHVCVTPHTRAQQARLQAADDDAIAAARLGSTTNAVCELLFVHLFTAHAIEIHTHSAPGLAWQQQTLEQTAAADALSSALEHYAWVATRTIIILHNIV